MRMVVQRVTRAKLLADGEDRGQMEKGLLVLVGFGPGDETRDCFSYMAEKLLGLRIFEDAEGKMNLCAKDASASVYLVSNFTLYGDARHGKRPSFSFGLAPAVARGVYEEFETYLRGKAEEQGVTLFSGVFQAEMHIDCALDGPVTILLDSDKLF